MGIQVQVPQNFSTRTMKALTSGNPMNITDSVQREIVAAVTTQTMVYTREPTPKQYLLMAEKIVLSYPVLKDKYGCSYVSFSVCSLYTKY